MRRLLVALLVAPLLSVLVLVSTETAAHACSCVRTSLAEQVATADVVLVGTVSAVESNPGTVASDGASASESPSAPSSGGSTDEPSGAVEPSQGGTTTAVFEVDKVFKGQAMQRERVTTSGASSACGVDLVADRRYLLIGSRTDASITTGSCDGTTVIGSDTLRKVERVAKSAGTDPTPIESPSEATMTRVDDGGPPTFTRVAAPGAAFVIVGFLGLLLTRRRRA